MNQEQWLAQYIESAFEGVRLGDGIDIYAAQSMDCYGNSDEDRKSLTAERHDWRRVPHGDLFSRFGAVTFLDIKGFRFYTPAIMTALLQQHDPSECLSSWFLSNLKVDIHGMTRSAPFDAVFSSGQRAALVRFLKYVIHNRARCFDVDLARRRLSELQTRV